ncbi:MAG: class I tRNA ligase family protein [Pseudonocardiaceae bacterium]
MVDEDFDPRAIDERWQRVWREERSWEVSNTAPAAKSAYVLEMLPYASGEPHVGHPKNYAVGDAVAHFLRRRGYYVLHPMGYDAFGLPAENHAIRTGKHPRVSTDESIASFREQFKQWGISIDWTREVSTHLPDYYRWTQWIFLQLFNAGLAPARETDATELDRPLGGLDNPLLCTRGRHRSVHDATGHRVRRDVPGAGPGASTRRQDRRGRVAVQG